jgi:hypothetical protein
MRGQPVGLGAAGTASGDELAIANHDLVDAVGAGAVGLDQKRVVSPDVELECSLDRGTAVLRLRSKYPATRATASMVTSAGILP